MRRSIVLVVLSAVASSAAGCVIVAGVRPPDRCKQVAVIDGEVYLVDTRKKRMEKLDAGVIVETEGVTGTRIEVNED